MARGILNGSNAGLRGQAHEDYLLDSVGAELLFQNPWLSDFEALPGGSISLGMKQAVRDIGRRWSAANKARGKIA
jgi:hypothetical protein